MSRVFNVNKADVVIYSQGRQSKRPPKQTRYTFKIEGVRDPMGQKQFNGIKDGRHPTIRGWMLQDETVKGLVHEVRNLVFSHIVGNKEAMVSVLFQDYHGTWMAPAIAELAADACEVAGLDVVVYHEDV